MIPLDDATTQQLRLTNPWLFRGGTPLAHHLRQRQPSRWLARTQLSAAGLLDPGKAHLLLGPRQAGKSSLVWSTLARTKRPLFVNLEEARMRQWCQSPSEFLGSLADLGPEPDALFFEEAQWLPEVGLFLKGLVDSGTPIPIIATGSASFQLRSKTRESLAGRATRDLLLPFGLAEVVPSAGLSPAELRLERAEALERLLELGGYPAVWTGAFPRRVAIELVEAFVFRDASDLFGVERLDAFDALLRLAAAQVSSLVRLSEWASQTGVSADTVRRYLSLMEQAHLIELLGAFVGGRRREVTSARKAYFLDNGMRTTLLSLTGAVTPLERGARMENFVFTELRKGLGWRQPIRYWRTGSKAEVDFVVPAGDRLLGVEVKAGTLGRPKLPRAARSFIDAYAPEEFWVVSQSFHPDERLGDTTVRWVPAITLPEAIRDWSGRA